jgi:hypothetical protein
MGDPRARHSRLNVEQLEDRAVPAAGVTTSLAAGTLKVTDWNANDTVVVRQAPTTVTLDAGGDRQVFYNVQHISLDVQTSAKLTLNNDWMSGKTPRDVYVFRRGATTATTTTPAPTPVKVTTQPATVTPTPAPQPAPVPKSSPTSAPAASSATGPTNPILSAAESLRQQFLVFVQTARPSIDDVDQGRAGTCVVLSSIAAVTNSGVNLAARITALGTNLYSVPLYRPGTGWIAQTVYYDGTWTANDPAPHGAGDFWVLLYQRAFLQEMGVNWNDPDSAHWGDKYGNSFRQIDKGLLALTGKATWDNTATLAELQQAASANRPTLALSHNTGEVPGLNLASLGVVSGHSYTVLGVRTDTAGTWVTLRNPWGTDGPIVQGANDGVITLSWGVFSAVMQGYCVA